MTRKIAILGATGSVGKSALDLVEANPDRFEVTAVTAASNVKSLADIARRTNAKLAVVADESRLRELRELLAGRTAGQQPEPRPWSRRRSETPIWRSEQSSAAPV